jgi:hypothetical protein
MQLTIWNSAGRKRVCTVGRLVLSLGQYKHRGCKACHASFTFWRRVCDPEDVILFLDGESW